VHARRELLALLLLAEVVLV